MGPPASVQPIAVLKPPPTQPPSSPGESQRPAVQNLRTIDPAKVLAPRGPPLGSPPSRPGPPSEQSSIPAVALTPSKRTDEYMMPGMMAMRVAPPKNILSSQGRWSKKPGAIPMFNNRKAKENALPPSDGKVDGSVEVIVEDEELPANVPKPEPGRLQAKPPPPTKLPPGAPTDKPAPPVTAPEVESKAPPPLRPAPNRNRAPPRLDPEEEAALRTKRAVVAPPSDEAPFAVKAAPISEAAVPSTVYAAAEESSDSDTEMKPAPAAGFENIGLRPKRDMWTVEDKPAVSNDPLKSETADNAVTRIASTEGRAMAQLPEGEALPDELEPPPKPAPLLTENKGAIKVADSYLTLPADSKPPKARAAASSLALKSGRLSVRLKEGSKFEMEGVKTAFDLFVKLRLGATEVFESKRSSVLRKASARPQFNEILSFDVIEPSS